jgi:hypothetical protein
MWDESSQIHQKFFANNFWNTAPTRQKEPPSKPQDFKDDIFCVHPEKKLFSPTHIHNVS